MEKGCWKQGHENNLGEPGEDGQRCEWSLRLALHTGQDLSDEAVSSGLRAS